MVDDDDRPLRSQKKRMGSLLSQATSIQIKEAEDIFGDMTEFLQEVREDQDEDYREDEEEPEEEEDDDLVPRHRRQQRQQQDTLSILRQHFEPDVLDEKFYTEHDEQIRVTDLPERFQLAIPNRPSPVNDLELKYEAEWIQKHGFADFSVASKESVPLKPGAIFFR